MKNCNFKLFALLLITTIVGYAQETKKETTATDNAAAIETKHDTVYPQFPGGNEALDKHLKVVGKNMIILEVDENGNTTLREYMLKEEDRNNIVDAIGTLPKWVPGTLDGKATRFCYIYSPDPKDPINKCINVGMASDHHKLLRGWYLINTDSEGVKQHPLYKDVKFVTLVLNMRYRLLHKTDKERHKELSVKVSDNTNEFTIEYNDSVSIAYRYSFNETNDTLTTLYTDANGKEQALTWAAAIRKPLLPPPPPSANQVIELIEIVDEDAE